MKGYSRSSVEFGLVVAVSEYIPGRSDYPKGSIYKRGDLYRAYRKRVELNAENCERDPSSKHDWAALLVKLSKPAPARP